MSGHEWTLVTEIWTPKRFFSAARGDSGQEKKRKSPERALCSQGMPETRRLTVHHKQYPYKPRNMWGRAGRWLRGPSGPSSPPKCFYFFCGCGQIKVGEVTFLSRTQSVQCSDSVCMCSVFLCVLTGKQRGSRSSWASWSCWLPWPERRQGEKINIQVPYWDNVPHFADQTNELINVKY